MLHNIIIKRFYIEENTPYKYEINAYFSNLLNFDFDILRYIHLDSLL